MTPEQKAENCAWYNNAMRERKATHGQRRGPARVPPSNSLSSGVAPTIKPIALFAEPDSEPDYFDSWIFWVLLAASLFALWMLADHLSQPNIALINEGIIP